MLDECFEYSVLTWNKFETTKRYNRHIQLELINLQKDSVVIVTKTGKTYSGIVTKSDFDGSGLECFDLSGQSVYCLNRRGSEALSISQGVHEFARRLQLDEPFERIRQAIEEAHSVLRAA